MPVPALAIIVVIAVVFLSTGVFSIAYALGLRIRHFTEARRWLFDTATHLYKLCSDDDYRQIQIVVTKYQTKLDTLRQSLKLGRSDKQRITKFMLECQAKINSLEQLEEGQRASDHQRQLDALADIIVMMSKRVEDIDARSKVIEAQIQRTYTANCIESTELQSKLSMIKACKLLTGDIKIALDTFEQHVQNKELLTALRPNLSSGNEVKRSSFADEIIHRFQKTVRSLYGELTNYAVDGKQLAILTAPTIGESFELFAAEIEMAKEQLQHSIDQGTQLEKDIFKIEAKIQRYREESGACPAETQAGAVDESSCGLPREKQDPAGSNRQKTSHLKSAEDAKEAMQSAVRKLSTRNILSHQRLFHIEVMAERLRQIKQLLELKPKSLRSELTECSSIANAIYMYLRDRRLQNDHQKEETIELAHRVDKLEHATQMLFIRMIKENDSKAKSSAENRKHYSLKLQYLQNAKCEQESAHARWTTSSNQGQLSNHEFLAAVAAQRCEKYEVLIASTNRNIQIIELLLHERTEERPFTEVQQC